MSNIPGYACGTGLAVVGCVPLPPAWAIAALGFVVVAYLSIPDSETEPRNTDDRRDRRGRPDGSPDPKDHPEGWLKRMFIAITTTRQSYGEPDVPPPPPSKIIKPANDIQVVLPNPRIQRFSDEETVRMMMELEVITNVSIDEFTEILRKAGQAHQAGTHDRPVLSYSWHEADSEYFVRYGIEWEGKRFAAEGQFPISEIPDCEVRVEQIKMKGDITVVERRPPQYYGGGYYGGAD